MNNLVKIILNDDGDAPYSNEDKWHLVDPCNWQGAATLCTSEFFGIGESSVVYKEKSVARGGVTCPDCMKMLIAYKAVKL